MELKDWINVIAILLSPLIAFQISKCFESWQETKQRKLNIFKTLMATRGKRVSHQHIEALNMIDLEFSENNNQEKLVTEAWKKYLNQLGKPDYFLESGLKEGDKLFINLLYEMSKCFSYKFNEVHIENSVYSPKGHGDNDLAFVTLREKLMKICLGEDSIPMKIVGFPEMTENPTDQQVKVLELLEKVLSGELKLKVEVEK
jgi:hypothetical protein